MGVHIEFKTCYANAGGRHLCTILNSEAFAALYGVKVKLRPVYHNKKSSTEKEKICHSLTQHRILLHSADKMDRDSISSLDTWCS
eukprot:4328651-Ditylum_brightwellii.AAC.1